MQEDQSPPDEETKELDSKSALMKLFLLVLIVFALTKWGLPLMNEMVDEFKKNQKEEANGQEEVISSSDNNTEDAQVSDVDKLKLAVESEINLWVKKHSPDSSATVKFINANDDNSKLAVEYLEENAAGETQSKELLFIKDEFGIYIYEDESGIRQIRVRLPN